MCFIVQLFEKHLLKCINRIRYFRIFHSKIRRKKIVEKNFIEKQEEKFVSPIALLYLMRRRMQCNLFFFFRNTYIKNSSHMRRSRK